MYTQRVDADGSVRIVGMDLLSHNDVRAGSIHAYTHQAARTSADVGRVIHKDKEYAYESKQDDARQNDDTGSVLHEESAHESEREGTRPTRGTSVTPHVAPPHVVHAHESTGEGTHPSSDDASTESQTQTQNQTQKQSPSSDDASTETQTQTRSGGHASSPRAEHQDDDIHFLRRSDLDPNYTASSVPVDERGAPNMSTSNRSEHDVSDFDQYERGGEGYGEDYVQYHSQKEKYTNHEISNQYAHREHVGGVYAAVERRMYSNMYTWQVTATVSKLGIKNARFSAGEHTLCGQRINCDSTVRDVRFASDTCPFGWSVRAIWRPRSDSRHLGAVARSEAGDVVACVYSPDVIGTGKVCVCVCV